MLCHRPFVQLGRVAHRANALVPMRDGIGHLTGSALLLRTAIALIGCDALQVVADRALGPVQLVGYLVVGSSLLTPTDHRL